MRLRVIRTVTVFVLLGLWLNFFVAQWIAWNADRREYVPQVSSFARWDHAEIDTREWRADCSASWGMMNLGTRYGEPEAGITYGPPSAQSAQAFLDELPGWLRHRVIAWVGNVDHPDPASEARIIVAVGRFFHSGAWRTFWKGRRIGFFAVSSLLDGNPMNWPTGRKMFYPDRSALARVLRQHPLLCDRGRDFVSQCCGDSPVESIS